MKYLLLILAVSVILRFVNLTKLPLYGDELTMVYDAYSLLKTGMDQTGASFPITFAMGAGRPGGYIYASIPFVYVFGPTELGIRFLSVLSGVGSTLLLFLIGRNLFNQKIGLFAAFLWAVNPWDISLSRGGFEAHLALFLMLLGVWTYLSYKKPWMVLISALSFGLAIHTYPTYKLVLPIFLGFLFYFKGINFKNIYNYIAAAFLLILVFVSVAQTITAGSETRFRNINIFSQRDLRERIIQLNNLERNINTLPYYGAVLFHNKVVDYSLILMESYMNNFSPDFLLFHGDSNPRHNMTVSGGIYLIQVVLIVLSVIYLWKREKKKFLFLAAWILIAPVPTALLLEPHFLRNSFMLPALTLLSAVGLYYLQSFNKYLKYSLAAIFIIQAVFFAERMYFLSPNQYEKFWAATAKKVTTIANSSGDDFIIISDRIDNAEYAYQVYSKINPQEVILQNKERETLNGYRFKKFGKVYIGALPDNEIINFINSLNGSVTYIGAIEERKNLGIVDIYLEKDRAPAFVVKKKPFNQKVS